jgi:hypothetical protein
MVPTRWLGMQGLGGNVSSKHFSALTSSLAASAALLVFWQSRAHPKDYFCAVCSKQQHQCRDTTLLIYSLNTYIRLLRQQSSFAVATPPTTHQSPGQDPISVYSSVPQGYQMALIRVLLLSLAATQAFAVDKSVVEEELSRAPAPFKVLAVNNAVKGNLPGLTAAACPLVMKTNTQITPFPLRTDAVCDSFGLGQANNVYACAAFGQMGSLLGKPDMRCAPDAIPPHPNTDTAGKSGHSAEGAGGGGAGAANL